MCVCVFHHADISQYLCGRSFTLSIDDNECKEMEMNHITTTVFNTASRRGRAKMLSKLALRIMQEFFSELSSLTEKFDHKK